MRYPGWDYNENGKIFSSIQAMKHARDNFARQLWSFIQIEFRLCALDTAWIHGNLKLRTASSIGTRTDTRVCPSWSTVFEVRKRSTASLHVLPILQPLPELSGTVFLELGSEKGYRSLVAS